MTYLKIYYTIMAVLMLSALYCAVRYLMKCVVIRNIAKMRAKNGKGVKALAMLGVHVSVGTYNTIRVVLLVVGIVAFYYNYSGTHDKKNLLSMGVIACLFLMFHSQSVYLKRVVRLLSAISRRSNKAMGINKNDDVVNAFVHLIVSSQASINYSGTEVLEHLTEQATVIKPELQALYQGWISGTDSERRDCIEMFGYQINTEECNLMCSIFEKMIDTPICELKDEILGYQEMIADSLETERIKKDYRNNMVVFGLATLAMILVMVNFILIVYLNNNNLNVGVL